LAVTKVAVTPRLCLLKSLRAQLGTRCALQGTCATAPCRHKALTLPTICSAGEAAGAAAGEAAAAGGEAGGGGGLHTLFTMVLGGLVGASPHMVSASVMALARLLHEFAAELGGAAPALLPAVLMLLRSRAREVVKAVLGFVKARAWPTRFSQATVNFVRFLQSWGGSGAAHEPMKVVHQDVLGASNWYVMGHKWGISAVPPGELCALVDA
jgi:hypothetical protein